MRTRSLPPQALASWVRCPAAAQDCGECPDKAPNAGYCGDGVCGAGESRRSCPRGEPPSAAARSPRPGATRGVDQSFLCAWMGSSRLPGCCGTRTHVVPGLQAGGWGCCKGVELFSAQQMALSCACMCACDCMQACTLGLAANCCMASPSSGWGPPCSKGRGGGRWQWLQLVKGGTHLPMRPWPAPNQHAQSLHVPPARPHAGPNAPFDPRAPALAALLAARPADCRPSRFPGAFRGLGKPDTAAGMPRRLRG